MASWCFCPCFRSQAGIGVTTSLEEGRFMEGGRESERGLKASIQGDR